MTAVLTLLENKDIELDVRRWLSENDEMRVLTGVMYMFESLGPGNDAWGPQVMDVGQQGTRSI